MADREKVIKGLECCVLRDPDDSRRCAECPKSEYGRTISNSCINGLMVAALALLKAQEPMVMAGAELTDAELIEEIRKAPLVLKPNVDAVPVVRCRDCKYYAINRLTKAYKPDKRFNPSVCIIGEFARPRKPDWYCADGERRDDDAADTR